MKLVKLLRVGYFNFTKRVRRGTFRLSSRKATKAESGFRVVGLIFSLLSPEARFSKIAEKRKTESGFWLEEGGQKVLPLTIKKSTEKRPKGIITFRPSNKTGGLLILNRSPISGY